ncbi:allatostatin-A receptor-like [Oppia nitens]|uniref:allatostatin-A receptor-like n=1 Tax=Oppia nitens TaxID=1686743 RepID=UPI0023DB9FD4|nr:allatostatin-A receptor-like [Oppia nitens]
MSYIEYNENTTDIDTNISNNRIFMQNPYEILNPSAINPAFIPIIVTHGITFLIGIIGNILVIITWSLRGRLRSPTAVFLVSLAVADMLLLLVFVPLETLEYFVISWDTGGNVCKMSSYVEMLSGMATVLNLVAVSIERFLVIVYPIKARSWCTMSSTRKGLVCVWSLALLLATPVLLTKTVYSMTYYNNTTQLTAYYCWDADDDLAFYVAVYQLLVMFVLPALFMIVCYFLVMQELWISNKSINTMTHSDSFKHSTSRANQRTECLLCWPSLRHHKQNIEETTSASAMHSNAVDITRGRKQVIKMLVLIVMLFMLCWGPRLVINVLIKLGLQSFSHSAYTARIACYLLSFIHSALNPFVYGLMSSNFRQMICHSCKKSNRFTNNSETYQLNRVNTYTTNSTKIANSFV